MPIVLPRMRSLVCALPALMLFGCNASPSPAPGDWTTPAAEALGIKLDASYDSSGAPVWDPNSHPSVFMVAEGIGFGGPLGGGLTQSTRPGLVVFDAASREVVVSANFDVASWGWKDALEPHGLGVSPEGDWIYVPTGETGIGRLLVVNARTLRVDKVLALGGQPHFVKAFRDAGGKALVLVESFNSQTQPAFVLDPANDNKVVGGWDEDQLAGSRSIANFISPDGTEVFVAARSQDSESNSPGTTIVRIDTGTWLAKGSFSISDISPVWIAFSADNKRAYINGSGSNTVFEYDRAEDRVVSQAGLGVERPYGTHFAWDDRYLYSIGAGDSPDGRSRVFGLTDTRQTDTTQGPRADQFSLDCVRGDHATLHPDPDANAFWVACDQGAQIVVFDIEQKTVTAHLPMPNAGSSHAGAFVNYNGWQGEVVSDLNGLQGSALAAKRKLLGLE